MTAEELRKQLEQLPGEALVMGMAEDASTYFITSVKSETHDDADGSTTAWLRLEEY